MTQNFSKKYLPFITSPKLISPLLPQKITIPSMGSFIEKLVNLKRFHCHQRNNTLQIVTDFDYTLTKFYNPMDKKHKQLQSIFGSFAFSQHLPSLFKKQLIHNYTLFGPYETDSNISFAERVTLVGQLYKVQLKLFKKHKITLEMIQSVSNNSKIMFRNGIKQFLQELKVFRIPMYIISGGISDMIHSLIQGITDDKDIIDYISIHSNQLQYWKPPLKKTQYNLQNIVQEQIEQFYEEKLYVKFKPPIIHSYNKYQVMEELSLHPPWQKNYNPHPPNCILMGDLVSDIYMSRVHPKSITLSIFFAKEGQTDQRAIAERKFDIIVQGDGSLKIVGQLLKVIMGMRGAVDWQYIKQSNKKLDDSLKWI